MFVVVAGSLRVLLPCVCVGAFVRAYLMLTLFWTVGSHFFSLIIFLPFLSFALSIFFFILYLFLLIFECADLQAGMVGACMYVDEYTCVDVWNFGICGVLMMIMNVCCVCAWASSRLRLAIIHVHIVHFVHYWASSTMAW